MSKNHSTSGESKPQRPDGSPLFWHQSGRWAKKIGGRMRYFGPRTKDIAEAERIHDEALAEYESVAADLHSGR
ncbi:MAG TPA: hypothetical protein VKE98_01915 [Gemmataceae bacterium]|nr:hypothetical protein [Gemmataceae bacterium]